MTPVKGLAMVALALIALAALATALIAALILIFRVFPLLGEQPLSTPVALAIIVGAIVTAVASVLCVQLIARRSQRGC